MLPGLRFVIAAILTTLVVAIFGLGAVVSLRSPALFPSDHSKARDLLADLAPPGEPAWKRNSVAAPASTPLVIDVPRGSADKAAPAPTARSEDAAATAAAAGDETTGSIGGVAPGRDPAADRTVAARPAQQTAAAAPTAPIAVEPSSDAPSAAVIIGDRPGRPPVLQQQSRPLRPEFIAQPSMPAPVEVTAIAVPRRTLAPIAVSVPVAAETRLVVTPVAAVPLASRLLPAAPSPPVVQVSRAPDTAKPLAMVTAQTAVPTAGAPMRDTGTIAVAMTEATTAARSLKPAMPAAAADTADDAISEAAALKTAPSPQRDAALTEVAADQPDTGSLMPKTAAASAVATPEPTPQQQASAAIAAATMAAAPAPDNVPAQPAAPEAAAPAPAAAETTITAIASKPAEPVTPSQPAAEKPEKPMTVAVVPSAIEATASVPTVTAIGKVPLPRPSPRRATLANADTPNATDTAATKPKVQRRRTTRRVPARQQAPRDGLAEFFFGAGKTQQKR